MYKRLLSMILVLCMIVSLIPVTALSAEDDFGVLTEEVDLSMESDEWIEPDILGESEDLSISEVETEESAITDDFILSEEEIIEAEETATETEEASTECTEESTEDEILPETDISEIQAMIDALPSLAEVEEKAEDAQWMEEMAESVSRVYEVYEALTEEEKLQIDATKMNELLVYLSQAVVPTSEQEEEDKPYLVILIYKGNQYLMGKSISKLAPYAKYKVAAVLIEKNRSKVVTQSCTWTIQNKDKKYVNLITTWSNYMLETKGVKSNVSLEASYYDSGNMYSAACKFDIITMQSNSNRTVLEYAALSALSYTNFHSSTYGRTIRTMMEKGAFEDAKAEFIKKGASTGETMASLYYSLAFDWKVIEQENLNSENGFVGTVFQNMNTGQYVIAYRGTEPNWGLIKDDLRTDMCLGMGLDADQFRPALQLYDRVKKRGGSIVLTGHSLGGGLANLVSVLRGARAVTFNAPSTMVSAINFYTSEFAANYKGLDEGLRVDYVNEKDWIGNTGVGDNPESTATSNITFLINQREGGKIDPTFLVVDQSAENGKGNWPAANHDFRQLIYYNPDYSTISIKTRSALAPSAYTFVLRGIEYLLGSSSGDKLSYSSNNNGVFVFGGAGNDIIRPVEVILSDHFSTSRGMDVICGGPGDDTIYGSILHDQRYYYTRGDGNDVIYDDFGSDKIYINGYQPEEIKAEIQTSDTGYSFYALSAAGKDIMRLQKDGSGKYTIYINGEKTSIEVWQEGEKVDIGSDGTLPRGKKSYRYVAACPVDMYVCDASDNVVMSLLDGTEMEQELSWGCFKVKEQDGEYVKEAVLYSNDYTVKLKGTGAGTMRYSCTITDGDSVMNRSVSDVPVQKDALYTTFTDFNEGILQGDLDGDGTIDYNAEYTFPEQVMLDKTTQTMIFADKIVLNATILPSSASQKVIWSSSDPDIAWVDENGLVTAIGYGNATITATSAEDEILFASCQITVSETKISFAEAEEQGNLAITVENAPWIYTGRPLEPSVSVTYKEMQLMEGIHYTVEYADNLAAGTATVTISGMEKFTDSVTRQFEMQEESDITVEQKVQRKVEQLTELCEESGADTDYRKALWFHDWLTANANYDHELKEYGPEGVLLKGVGVCQSYTLAYKALLDAVGIENIVVTAPEMDHAWNIVKIKGSWTHIDCTWDDPNSGGMEHHGYFGLSDEDMKVDHIWDYSKYPACSRIQREISLDALPDPYELDAPVEGIDFALVDTDGNLLTRNKINEEHTLLIYGREGCGNTLSFLTEITPWADILAQSDVKVIVVYENQQEAALNSGRLPFTCASEIDLGFGKWDFLERIGITESYTYPLIVLQNRQGYVFYSSTDYVTNAERVLATAVQELPETEDIHFVPVYYYADSEEMKASIENALESGMQTVRLCNWKKDELDVDELNLAIDLLNQYGSQYGGEWSSYRIMGKVMEFKIEYFDKPHTHQWITVPAVAATCQNAGRTEFCYCELCGMVLKEQEVIAPVAHKWGAWEMRTASTCLADGVEHRTCESCGKKETRTIKATGAHQFGAYVVTKQPTVLAAGVQTRTCAVCHTTESTEIAKLSGVIHLTTKKLPLQVKKNVQLSRILKDLVAGDSIVSCVSSKPKVATVDNNGKVVGKSAGTTVVTITLASGVSDKVTIVVQKKAVAASSITNVTKSLKLKLGEKYTLAPVINPITTADKASYSSSNKKIVTVSKKGVITAKKSGTAKITVKVGKKKVTVKVTVEKVAPTGINGVPASKTLKKGKSFTIKPKLTPSGAEAKIIYSSSNKKVATVNTKGKVTAKKKGTATITVKAGGVTKTCVVTVK